MPWRSGAGWLREQRAAGRAGPSLPGCTAATSGTWRMRAVAGQPVVIHLTVRRFFCPAAGCPAVTFAEQVPGLTWRYGRRTPVARRVLEAIGLALGGRAGQGWPPRPRSQRVGRPCCAWSAPCPSQPGPRLWSWALMISRCAAARATEPCWQIWSPGGRWTCWRAATPRSWPTGCPRILGCRSSAGTARPPMPRAHGPGRPTPCRSPTAGTCGATSPKPLRNA